VNEAERFWAKVSRSDSCWIWTAATRGPGYGAFRVGSARDGTRRTVPAHRYMYELINGSVSSDLQVCHRCDNPPCVRPDHLFLGTNADNIADKVAKGRAPCGMSSPNHRLTDADVIGIRRACEAGDCQRKVAARFGVCQRTVSRVVRRELWRHIP
jgi:hypothetical protein